jgi:hypothetical protein
MGFGKKYWGKTEGGTGGNRGHSNMDHREHTAYVKNGSRKARRAQDKAVIDIELRPLNGSQMLALLRASDRDRKYTTVESIKELLMQEFQNVPDGKEIKP